MRVLLAEDDRPLADGLAVIPRGEGELSAGAEVEIVALAAQAASM